MVFLPSLQRINCATQNKIEDLGFSALCLFFLPLINSISDHPKLTEYETSVHFEA